MHSFVDDLALFFQTAAPGRIRHPGRSGPKGDLKECSLDVSAGSRLSPEAHPGEWPPLQSYTFHAGSCGIAIKHLIRTGILLLILGPCPSPGPGPSNQTNGIRINLGPLGGQKLILIPFVWLLGPGPGEGQRPGIRMRIQALI